MLTDLETVRAAMPQINPAMLSYEEWVAVGMTLKDAGGDFSEWDTWSRADRRYKPGEMQAKWNSFKRANGNTVGVGSIVKLCRDQGGTIETRRRADTPCHPLEWDAVIGGREAAAEPEPRPVLQVVRPEWLQVTPLPEPGDTWNNMADFSNYLRALFSTEEYVSYVPTAYQSKPNSKGETDWVPTTGICHQTAGQLLEALAKEKDLGGVIGDWHKEAGAWIRFNPMDGKGVSDDNVTSYRFALVESDDLAIERQYAIYKKLDLPIAALVFSGGKSLHAIVRIEAPDYNEYVKRVDFLYGVCKENGLSIDRQNRNPSRLSRLPGATRNGQKQWLVATGIGKATWGEWVDWISIINSATGVVKIPAWRSLGEIPTPIRDEPNELLRHRALCRGGAALLVAGTGAGKSSLSLQFAAHVTAGIPFFGIEPCRPLSVAVIQGENDDGDMAEIRDGVATGITALGWDAADIVSRIHFITERVVSGKAFGDYVRHVVKTLPGNRPLDLLIVDPLFSFFGDDVSDQKQVSGWTRHVINPVLSELNIGLLLIHHTNKPSVQEGTRNAGDFSYMGSGSSEWCNWARAVLVLQSTPIPGLFELKAAKRGSRLRWKDTAGVPTYSRFIAHAKTGIYWTDAVPDDLQRLASVRPAGKHPAKAGNVVPDLDQVVSLVTEPMLHTALRDLLHERLVIAFHPADQAIADAVTAGRLQTRPEVKVPGKRGKPGTYYGRPEQFTDYPGAPWGKASVIPDPIRTA